MQVTGKRILVVGMARSGIAVAKLLCKAGATPILNDSKEEASFGQALDELRSLPCQWRLGRPAMELLDEAEGVVISPGIPDTAPFVVKAREMGLEVIGELEMAFELSRGITVAVTGTNGKTTTVSLLGEMFKNAGKVAHVVGNIGYPYSAAGLESHDEDVMVTEVSSFQLETIMDFHPNVSAILNITPDHLDRHKTMECYIEVKEGIAKNQTEEDTCVLNYDDAVLREFGQDLKPKVIFFSSRHTLDEGLYLDGETIVWKEGSKVTEIINVNELKLLGRHNHENVMAAVAISSKMGVPMDTIRKVLREFKAVEHRIEFVTERFGVKYYNDSKGTNPDAAMQAIKAMPGPTLLIAGGYDKHSEVDEWIESFDGKVRYLVLIGQTRDKIADCAKKHGFTDIMYAEDLLEAVQVCASYANIGDNVLLSPACASWGMFKNFEERGEKFKEYVRSL